MDDKIVEDSGGKDEDAFVVWAGNRFTRW